MCMVNEYRIRSNYRTVRLSFSKLLEKLVVKQPANNQINQKKFPQR